MLRDGKVGMSDDNFWYEPTFKLNIPKQVGVDPKLLDPPVRDDGYEAQANHLASIFQNALTKLDVSSTVAAAAPAPLA